jgi:hypothetical protein
MGMGMGGWQWCGEAEAMKHEGGEIMGAGAPLETMAEEGEAKW